MPTCDGLTRLLCPFCSGPMQRAARLDFYDGHLGQRVFQCIDVDCRALDAVGVKTPPPALWSQAERIAA